MENTKKISSALKDSGFDALIVSNPKNLYYASGISSGVGVLTGRGFVVFLNELDFEIYGNENNGNENKEVELRVYEEGCIKKILSEIKASKIGVENMGITRFLKLEEELEKKIYVSEVIEKTRMLKTEYEIECIRKSAEIAKKVFEQASGKINENTTETEAAAEIDCLLRKNGSEGTFEDGILISSGPDASKIHAKPQNKKIKGLTVVDIGAIHKNYFSDITRTFPVNANSEELKVLEFVQSLELELIDSIHAGMKASEIHNSAEEKIKNFGFKFFHSIGHGVGLDVHEMPALNKKSDTIITENMVFTIEPGIYKANKFGVRFEDTVLMKKNKCEIL